MFVILDHQILLHFTARRKDTKKEEDHQEHITSSTEIQPLAATAAVEADDGGEDDETSQGTSTFNDSGICTGLDDERLASVRRRRRNTPMNARDSEA